jgi:WhiB family transcriptional regulator, redox-sensing transcriptional regulator
MTQVRPVRPAPRARSRVRPRTLAPLAAPDVLEPDTTPCQREDPELWFAESSRHLARAKALCAECPVRAACLSGALARGEPWGVWGGEIFENGRVVATKRGRGRPPKQRTAA